jgi:hypothetical protein
MNISDEPEAVLLQRFHKILIASIIAKRATGAIDPAAQGSFRDHTAIPDRFYQFILADDAITVTNQMNDDVEHLGLDMHKFACSTQFTSARINFELGKAIFQPSLDWLLRRCEVRRPLGHPGWRGSCSEHEKPFLRISAAETEIDTTDTQSDYGARLTSFFGDDTQRPITESVSVPSGQAAGVKLPHNVIVPHTRFSPGNC